MTNKSTNARFVNPNPALKNVTRSIGLLLIMTFSFFATTVYAQIPVTVTNPGNTSPALAASYTSLANAVTALNATTAMTGPVIFTLGAGSETAPNTGLVIGSASLDAVLSATNTVTFFATPNTATLNAGSGGAGGPGSAVQNGILALDGADYITIDGLRLVDGTTTAAEYMEWGIGMFKSSVTNGCQHNTIQNCTIILNRANNTTSPTNFPEGSRGIQAVSALITAQVGSPSVLTTSASGSNSFNRFYSNTIENCNIGIALMGTNTSVIAPTAHDTANDIGGNSAATGNIIRNFGGGGTIAAYGIRALTQRELNVSYNTLISNNGSGTDHAGVLRGILNASSNPTSPANVTISNNNIRLSGSGTSATAIEASFAGTANGANTVSITNNTIQNSTLSTASGTYNGILNSSIAANLNITGNIVTGNSLSGASSPVFNGISTTGTASNLNVNTNTITNNTATGTGTMSLIDVSSGSTTAITSVSNNIMTGNFKTGVSGTFAAISTSNAAALTVNANNIYNNGINTASGTGSGACTVYGYFYSTTTSSASEIVTNNTIGKLLITSPTSSTANVLYGMNLGANTTIAGGVTKTISGNTIDTLVSTLSTAAAGGTVSGIVNNGATTTHTVNIFKNKIYNLSAGGTAGRVHGIGLITGTTTNIYNNLVGDLKAPTANSAAAVTSLTTGAGVYGITIVAGTTANLYYNTVQQQTSSTGPDFNTASVFAISTATNLEMRNNIFSNRSTPGANGKSVAYRRGGISLTSYSTSSNNNLFYQGTPGAQNLIYYDGTNSDQTLVLYKGRVTPADNFSIRENPPFLSTNGLDATFLHINTATPTQIESGGATIATYTDDYDGNIRNASTPDIGADEFAGTPAVVVNINNVLISPPGNACVAIARTVTANVTAGSTDISSVVINYSFNGGAPVPVTMTGGNPLAGSTSNWTGTIPAASPVTATVTWQVVATDDATSKLFIGTSYADEPLTGAVLYTKAVPNPVCSGSPVVLTAALAKADQTINVGTGATTQGNFVSPFYGSQGNKHTQYLWRASELIAAGMGAGNITSVTFYTTSGTAASQDYSVKLGNTAVSDMTSMVTSGLTTVFSAASYTQAVGANLITLNTPFFWDGSSNLVMEICMGNAGSASTVSSTVKVDNTSFTSTSKTNLTTATSGSSICTDFSSTFINYTQRPQVTFKAFGSLTIAGIVWNDGSTNVGTTNPLTQNPVSTTTYTATATDVNGCTLGSLSPLTVTTLALPAPPNPNNATQCGTGAPTVFVTSGGAGGGFRWYSAQTGGTLLQDGGATYTTSISTTTIFWVSESNGTCESPRVQVTATVIIPDAIQAAVDDNLTCINSQIQLSAVNTAPSPTNTYTYTWTASPSSGSGISGSVTGNAVTITPTAANTYTYTATGIDGSCTAVSTVTVVVQSLPIISSVTATPGSICPGSSSNIKATTPDLVAGVANVGAQTTTSTSGTPFRATNGKAQYLYLASELTAAGLRQGNITSLGFTVTAGTPLPITGWQLSIGATAVTTLPTTFITGLSTVYGPASITPVSGLNTITFGTPFAWNGTSNIVVEVCEPTQSSNTLTVAMTTISGRSMSTVLSTGCAATSGSANTVRPTITFNGQVDGFAEGDYSWSWQPGALSGNSVFVSPSSTTTYTVTATDPATTCSLTGTVTVNLFSEPPAPSGNNSEQCGTFPPAATVSSNSGAGSPVYVWYDAPAGGTALQTGTSNVYLQAVSVTTDFYVAERSANGCDGPRVQVTAIVNVPDPLIAAASSTAICPNESVTLSVTQDGSTNTYEYTWSAVPAAGSGIPSPVASTPVTVTPTVFNTFYDYVVTGYDADKGCTVTDTVRVTVHPLPSISAVTATPSTVCSGQTIQLAATTNVGNPLHVKVGTGTTGFSGAANPYYRNQEGLKVQILYLASDILAAGFTAGPIDAVSFNVTAIQAGTPEFHNYKISLAHTTAAGLSASTFATAGLTQVYGPTDFTVTLGVNVHTFNTPFIWDGVSNILFQGCFDNDPNDICTVNCTGAVPSVENTSGFAYNPTAYANLNNTSGGPRDMCATVSATSTATSRPNITFRRGIFNNTAFYNWQWMPGALTGPVVTTTLVNTTTYTVTATDADGCTNTGTVTATALPLPSTPVATPSSQCGIGIPAASVTGDPGVVFKWYDAPTGGNLVQTGGSTYASSISTTTHFWVSASDATCEGLRAEVVATVVQPDPVTALVNDNSVCLGTAIQLTANQTGSTNTYSYTWVSSPASGSGVPSSVAGSPVTVTPTATGTYTYTVIAFDPNTGNPGIGSCTVLSSVTVVVNPNPVITTAIATPSAICNGESTVLSGTSIVNPAGVVTIGTPTETVSTYNAPFYGGIEANKHQQIMILASELSAAGVGFSTNINSLGFPSVADNAEIKNFTVKLAQTSASNMSAFVTTGLSQVYFRAIQQEVGNTNNIINFDTPFAWDGISNLVIDICFADPAPGSNFLISDAQVMITPFVSVITTHSNSATIPGIICPDITSGLATYTKRPIVLVGHTGNNQTTVLNWIWNPGSNPGNPVTVSPTTTTSYTATATYPATGCFTQSAPVTVTVNPVPATPTASNSAQCGFGVPTASVSGAGGTYNWYDAPTGGSLLQSSSSNTFTSPIGATTTFYVAESNGNCESGRVAVTVTVTNPDPVQASVNDNSVCPGTTIQLSAANTAGSPSNTYTYSWTASPAAGSGIPSGNVPGSPASVTPATAGTYTYTVLATDATAGCATTATVTVTVFTPPLISTVSANPSTPVCAGQNVQLTATSNVGPPQTFKVGTGTTGTTTGASPYFGASEGFKAQYLYRASDILASGLTAGPISALSFNVTNLPANSLPLQGFNIKIASTGATALTAGVGGWITAGMTQVYSTASSIQVLGMNTYNFSAPFNWDGVSNIVVQTCWDNDPGNTCASSCTGGTPSVEFTSSVGYQALGTTFANNSGNPGRNLCDTALLSSTQANRPNVYFLRSYSNNTGLYSWLWNPGAVAGPVVTVTPSSTTSYTVTATDANGCISNSSPITVTVNPRPTGVITGGASYCAGQGSTTTNLSVAVTGAGPWSGTLSPGAIPFSGSTSPITVSVTPSSTTTYTIATLNGSQCSSIAADLTGSATVTINPTPATPTITPAGPVTQCGGTVTLTASSPGAWQWNLEGSPIGGATNQTLVVSASGNYSVTVTNEFGCSATSAATSVTINPVPATPTISAGGPTTFCAGGSVTLTSSSATNNQWNLNGSPIGGATNSTLVVTASGDYTVTVTNGFGCSATSAITTVTVNPLAANPTATVVQPTCALGTGTINVTSPLGSGNTYSLDGINFQASPSFPGQAPGTYTVYVNNSFGCFSPATVNVTVNPQPFIPGAPVVSGIVNVCPYVGVAGAAGQVTYTATATGFGTQTFTWVVPPTNVTIVSGQGTPTLVLSFQNGFATQSNKQIRLTVTNQCGTGPMTIYYLAAQIPNTPNPIVGPTDACPLLGGPAVSYTIPKAPGAASYNWNVPQVGTGTIVTHPNGAGANDTTILVSFLPAYTTGTITVQSINDCGVSGLRSITVTRIAPSQPNIISGPTSACPYITPNAPATYTVPAVPGVTYTWSGSNGAIMNSAQGSNTMSVTYPIGYTGGTISVTATTGCGTSVPRNLTITTLNPATPGVPDVIQTHFCGEVGGRKYTYTLASYPSNATSVLWTVPAGATFINLSAISIEVTYPDAAVNGVVTVQASNPCANSVIRSVNVKLPACPVGFAANNGTNGTAESKGPVVANTIPVREARTGATLEVKIFPNPTVSDFKLEVLTSGTEEITVRVLDNLGRLYKNFKVMPYQTIALGAELKAGSYLIEVRQGSKMKTTKLTKF